MADSDLVIAAAPRVILQPVLWVLRCGWLSTAPVVLEVEGDAAAARLVRGGEASVALLDPIYWALHIGAYRPVPRTCVALSYDATDMLLLGEVRLDELETVSASPTITGTAEEVVARTLVRDYYGVQAPLKFEMESEPHQDEGRIVAGLAAMRAHSHAYVESLSRAWWVMTGTPWVRALPVEAATSTPEPGTEALFREIGRLLATEAETVATGVARTVGGDEERWLGVVRALSLSYGAEERKALSALLAAAARLRLCPRVEDVALPRY